MTSNEEALVADLCWMIVQSRNYAAIPWQALSVVCDVQEHGSTNVTGYAFTQDPAADRPWQAEMPDPSREFLDTLRALNAAMHGRTGAKWKTCLVQVVRDGMKFTIDFEYDREDRWFPTPGTPARKGFPLTINPLLSPESNDG